jgi:putative transposase
MPNHPLKFDHHYHIYSRGNNRENLFTEPRNYPYFLALYTKHIQPVAKTYAYCLLPNHFHFFIKTRTEEEQEAFNRSEINPTSKLVQSRKIEPIVLTEPIFTPKPPSRAFNNMFIAYARAFNKTNQRTGVLFEAPFGRKNVNSETYFLTLITYIHRNPEKHGLVPDYRNWKWSSFGTFLSTQPTKIERDLVLSWFGGLDAFLEMHASAVDESLISPLIDDRFEYS